MLDVIATSSEVPYKKKVDVYFKWILLSQFQAYFPSIGNLM